MMKVVPLADWSSIIVDNGGQCMCNTCFVKMMMASHYGSDKLTHSP